jgi:hypothetical protein
MSYVLKFCIGASTCTIVSTQGCRSIVCVRVSMYFMTRVLHTYPVTVPPQQPLPPPASISWHTHRQVFLGQQPIPLLSNCKRGETSFFGSNRKESKLRGLPFFAVVFFRSTISSPPINYHSQCNSIPCFHAYLS